MTRVTLVLVSVLSLVVALATSRADERPDDLTGCRDLPSDEARLACYDDAIDQDNQRAAAKTSPVSTPKPTTAESQEADFGKSAIELQRSAVEQDSATGQNDELEARVVRLQWTRSKYFVVTLDNDQVWRQIDSGNLRLSTGDVVIIRKASLGSFLMQKAGSKRSIRVKRSK